MKLDHHQRSAGERQSTLHLSVRAKVSRLENRAAAARKADLSSLATCVGVSSSLSSAALAVAARRRRPLAQAPLAPDSATFNCRPKTLTFGHAFSVAFELLRRANRGLRSDSGRRCCRSSVRPCVCVRAREGEISLGCSMASLSPLTRAQFKAASHDAAKIFCLSAN